MAEVDEIDYNDPNQPTVTEELLQIIEEFGDYIDKFMFEIVTFLAVIDSSMGLIKDVLAMFGFSGWKMTFFPTFSFVVTIGVFLFGTKKRKGKRNAEAAELEGLGQAMEMFDDVLEVVDDVLEEVEKVEGEAGGLGLGDYSDSDEDDDDNAEKTEINESGTTNVVVDIEVAQGEEAQEPQQQDTEAEPPPKSSVAKAIGMAIMVAGIVAKIAGKGKTQEPQQDENTTENGTNNDITNGNSQNNPGGCMTGDQVPPTDLKSKPQTDTCSQNRHPDDTLAEIAEDLKQESIEIATNAKNDAIKATEVVIEGSKEAGVIVHDNTKAALASTGALKAGHGLYREVDFISGRLKKEGLNAGKALEKETFVVAKQVQGNKIVKDTGADKLGLGVYREAAFITTHVGKGTKDVLHQEEQKVAGLLGQSGSAQGHPASSSSLKKAPAYRDHRVLDKNKDTRSTGPRQNNQSAQVKTNTISVTDHSQQRRQVAAIKHGDPNQEHVNTSQKLALTGDNNIIHDNKRHRGTLDVGYSQEGSRRAATKLKAQNQAYNKQRQEAPHFEDTNFIYDSTKQALTSTGTLKLGHGLYREAEFITGHVKNQGIETGRKAEKETTEAVNTLRENKLVKESGLDSLCTGAYRDAAFVGGLLCDETNKAIRTGQQGVSQLSQPGPSGVKLENIDSDNTTLNNKAAVLEDIETGGSTKIVVASNEPKNNTKSSTVYNQQLSTDQQETDNKKEKGSDLVPQADVTNMAANVVDGVAGAAGSVTNEAMNIDKKAQEGVQQAAKKSKGLLPIIMRLVRLIMRVANKGKGSNSASSSRRASVASAADSKGTEPSKEKRSASVGGDAAGGAAGAAASLAMGAAAGGGGKGGKIGAIVGIVVRLVRLASKLKGGGKGADGPASRSNSTESIDEQSDDEFFDCGEDFPTAEMETQTEDMYLLPVTTQAAIKDLRADSFGINNDGSNNFITEESLTQELKSIALELQEVACENATSSLSGLADRLRSIGSDRTPLLDDTDHVTVEDHPYSVNFRPEKQISETLPAISQTAKFSDSSNPSNVITLKILPPSSPDTTSATENPRTILIDLGSPVPTVHTTADIERSQTCNINCEDGQTLTPIERQNIASSDRQNLVPSNDRQSNFSSDVQNITSSDRQNIASAQRRRRSLSRGDSSGSCDEQESKELENQIKSWNDQSIPQNQNYRTSLEIAGSGTYNGFQQPGHETQLQSGVSSASSQVSFSPSREFKRSSSSRDVLVDVHTPRTGGLGETSSRNESYYRPYDKDPLFPGHASSDECSRTFSFENDQRTLDRQSSWSPGAGIGGTNGGDNRSRTYSSFGIGQRTINRKYSYSSDDVNSEATESLGNDRLRTVDRQSSYSSDCSNLSKNIFDSCPKTDSRTYSSFENKRGTIDRQSSYSTDRNNLTTSPLVAYDSSCEDISRDHSYVYRRRPSVVRFEDECALSSNVDTTATMDVQRDQPLKPVLKYTSTTELEQRQTYLQSAGSNTRQRPHVENASGRTQQTTRLDGEDPQPRVLIGHQTTSDTNIGRTSYLYDDEFESNNSLC